MRQAFVFLFCMFSAAQGFACSMQVDENYTKNFLITHAVSFNDLPLSSVSGIALADYDLSFSSGESLGSCPEYMFTSGRVSFNHSPSAIQNCSYAVTVVQKTYSGTDLPDGPFEEITFSNPVASCSISISGVRVPRNLPARIKKPIIIRKFPR